MTQSMQLATWDSGKINFQRKLGNFVQYFQVNLPTNVHGVPMKLINPVVIAENMLDCKTTDDLPDEVVEDAIMNVEFEEGIPVIEGFPIWEKLEGEPMDSYKYFKAYRDMPYTGTSRAIMRLAGTLNVPARVLSLLSKVYHWQLRCRAYDIWRKQERERIREYEIEKLEARHTKASKTLLEAGLSYIEKHPEQLNPKVALQMIQVAMRAGRLALGLNADKPGSGDTAPSININQTTHTQANEVVSTTTMGSSPNVDADVGYLQSIVHILDQSGALAQAKQEAIDAEFTEVSEDSAGAVEGA